MQEHFNKHGSEFGYASTSQYVSGANSVINSPDSLHKTKAEDGDGIYYIQATNELVILSTEGYIRTYLDQKMEWTIITDNNRLVYKAR